MLSLPFSPGTGIMTGAAPGSSGEEAGGASDPAACYASALYPASRNLQADPSDIERLLVPIQDRHVPPQQVSGLLRQAWLRRMILIPVQ